MIDIIFMIVASIILIVVIVGVHELGHFLAARKFGVHVIRFKIGFGKDLITRLDKNGTEFSIGLLPLGGYVQMLGEDNPMQGTETGAGGETKLISYNEITHGARAIITLAGPLANFLLAVLAYFLIFVIGTKELPPIVGFVHEASLAEEAGLEVGDRILEVDGSNIVSLNDFNQALATRIGETGSIKVKFVKGSNDTKASGIAKIDKWLGSEDLEESILTTFGIEPFSPIEISEVLPSGSAYKSGLLKQDKVLGIGGVPVKSLRAFQEMISSLPDTNTFIEIERKNEIVILPLDIESTEDVTGIKRGLIGVRISVDYSVMNDLVITTQEDPFRATYLALEKTYGIIILIIDSIGKMLTGAVSSDNIGGPIQIGKIAGLSAMAGFIPFISTIAFISINLGLINLLPIPILDGGQLVLIAAEKIKGSEISESFLEYFYRLGLLALLLIMSLAVFNDIGRLI